MKLVEAFKNPVTRPRALILTGSILTFALLFVTVAVGATTSYWFCAEVCHKVQDDTIASYQNSTHSKVSCVACHMPAGANPVTFLLHKAHALGELPPTVANTYHLPLNKHSEIAMDANKFPSSMCLQCHSSIRADRTSEGIIMDHPVHIDEWNIACTVCHNRIAHREEGIEMTLFDPATGELSARHSDFMKMAGCFRCHRVHGDGQSVSTPYLSAGGECSICHTASHDLIPADHKVGNFAVSHGEAAFAENDRVLTTLASEHTCFDSKVISKGAPSPEALAVKGVPCVESLNRCYNCHALNFCADCHGVVPAHRTVACNKAYLLNGSLGKLGK